MLYRLLMLAYVKIILCSLYEKHEQNGNKTETTLSTSKEETSSTTLSISTPVDVTSSTTLSISTPVDDTSSTTLSISTPVDVTSSTTLSISTPVDDTTSTTKTTLSLSSANKVNEELILETANDLVNENAVNNLTLKLVTFTSAPLSFRRTLLDLIITKIVKYITVSRTTPRSTIPDLNSVYLKSKQIRDLIKKNMVKYKRRKIKNRKIDEKLGKKRGIPKKIVTATKRVPMKKSKYYIRKYVRKDLYKMTTTTPKPTRDPWRYWTKEKVKKKKSKLRKLLELYQQKQDRAV